MAKTIEVSWDDQRNINSFNKLNSDLMTTNALLQESKKTAEGHEEAQNELMLVDDDDAARYLFGQCFVHITTESADERITKEAERLTEEISKMESRKADLEEQLSGLKETLYAKFGSQINLEE